MALPAEKVLEAGQLSLQPRAGSGRTQPTGSDRVSVGLLITHASDHRIPVFKRKIDEHHRFQSLLKNYRADAAAAIECAGQINPA